MQRADALDFIVSMRNLYEGFYTGTSEDDAILHNLNSVAILLGGEASKVPPPPPPDPAQRYKGKKPANWYQTMWAEFWKNVGTNLNEQAPSATQEVPAPATAPPTAGQSNLQTQPAVFPKGQPSAPQSKIEATETGA